MTTKLCLFFALLVSSTPISFAQPRTDLAGIAFIIDPGHSQNENVGIYGYSEAYKVLDVALHLREFLRLPHKLPAKPTASVQVELTCFKALSDFLFLLGQMDPGALLCTLASDQTYLEFRACSRRT